MSYFMPFISVAILYFILFKLSKNILTSFWMSIITVPLFFGIFIYVLNKIELINYTFPDQLAYYSDGLLSIPFPLNYRTGWFETIFHTRAFFIITYMLSVYFFIRRKFYTLLFIVLISFFVHPNNALTTYCIFSLGVIYLFFTKQVDYKYCILFFSMLFIGAIPNLIKLSTLNFEDYRIIDNITWYINTIRDEGDDFSALYLLFYRKSIVVINLIFPIIGLMFFLYCLDIISKNGPFNFIKIFNNFSEKIKNNFNNDFYHQNSMG